MGLTHLQKTAWRIAEAQGLHDNLRGFPIREATLIRLALILSEFNEALQEVKRHGVSDDNQAKLGHELADVVIRVADLAEELHIDLAAHAEQVCAANRLRPYKYGTPEEA